MSKVVVITGASGGIGRATARKFAEDGARVALLARGREALQATADEVEQRGGKALVLPTDVADADAVDAAASATEEALGPIDVWVNDAIATLYAPFWEIEPEEYVRATEVCYLGAVWGTRSALKRMMPRDAGSIVQVGSAMAYRSIPLQSPYCGAKHAIVGFTESVITELLHEGSNVHVGMVQLPGINTTQFTWSRTKLGKQTQPVPPIYQPEVAADAIHYAATSKRREILVGGPTLMNVWGNRLVPWLMDRQLSKSGYSSQMTQHDLDPNGHDNLFKPVDEDRGSHGPFDDKAHPRSLQLMMTKRRGALLGAATAVAAAGAGLAAARHG